jgi:hypothetical protein
MVQPKIDASAAGERLELSAQGPGAKFDDDPVGIAHERFRGRTIAARPEECFGFSPAGVGGLVGVVASFTVPPGIGPQSSVAGAPDP